MKKCLLSLFVALMLFFALIQTSEACSRKIRFLEKSEATTLKYWTAAPLAFATVFASSIATYSESDETNKTVPIITMAGLYVGVCGFGSGDQYVDQTWIDTHPDLREKITPKPSTPEDIEKQKRAFYEERAQMDKVITITSVLGNIANALVAQESTAKIIGYGGALINLTYYLIDPNNVREQIRNNMSLQISPSEKYSTVTLTWNY